MTEQQSNIDNATEQESKDEDTVAWSRLRKCAKGALYSVALGLRGHRLTLDGRELEIVAALILTLDKLVREGGEMGDEILNAMTETSQELFDAVKDMEDRLS